MRMKQKACGVCTKATMLRLSWLADVEAISRLEMQKIANGVVNENFDATLTIVCISRSDESFWHN